MHLIWCTIWSVTVPLMGIKDGKHRSLPIERKRLNRNTKIHITMTMMMTKTNNDLLQPTHYKRFAISNFTIPT